MLSTLQMQEIKQLQKTCEAYDRVQLKLHEDEETEMLMIEVNKETVGKIRVSRKDGIKFKPL